MPWRVQRGEPPVGKGEVQGAKRLGEGGAAIVARRSRLPPSQELRASPSSRYGGNRQEGDEAREIREHQCEHCVFSMKLRISEHN